MKINRKALFSAAASLGLVASLAVDADACGGRGGRGYAPRYYPQRHVQPYCPPKQVAHYPPQQIPQQHIPQQQFPQQQFPQQQFSQQQFPGQPAAAQPLAQPQFAGQQPVAQQPVGQTATQQVFGQQQQVAAQPQAAPQQPAQNGIAATPISTAAPQPAAPSTQAAPAPSQPAQQAPAQNSAEMMALEALTGLGDAQSTAPAPSQPEPAAQSAVAVPVGQFVARMSSGATIRLTLQQNGAFVWTATNKGKDSSFQGQFSLSGGSLKLLRSNDNQKLEGAFAQTQNGFTFQLGGDRPTNLTFVRG